MKVRASLKKRSIDCKIVRRKGRLYIINKKIQDLNKDKDKLWLEYQGLTFLNKKEALSH